MTAALDQGSLEHVAHLVRGGPKIIRKRLFHPHSHDATALPPQLVRPPRQSLDEYQP